MKSIFCNYVVKKNASIATSCLPYIKMCQRVKNAALHKHDLATFLHCCFLCMLKSVLCAFPKRIALHWSYKVHSTDISLYRLAIFSIHKNSIITHCNFLYISSFVILFEVHL